MKSEVSFNSEVEAFLKLPFKHGSQYVVKYYGSFIQGDTYTIILEYADGGSLLEFYRRERPPKTWDDLRKFWDSMFRLLEALAVIHNVRPSTASTSSSSSKKRFQAYVCRNTTMLSCWTSGTGADPREKSAPGYQAE